MNGTSAAHCQLPIAVPSHSRSIVKTKQAESSSRLRERTSNVAAMTHQSRPHWSRKKSRLTTAITLPAASTPRVMAGAMRCSAGWRAVSAASA